MLLADVVTASSAVAATRSRTAKAEVLADLLRDAALEEVAPTTAWVSGELAQGRLGVGWRTLAARPAGAAAEARLTVTEVDDALTALAATTGAGSAARRGSALAALLGAATADEQHFLVRLLAGELRQGALEGVVLDAVARASGVGLEAARRAFMLSGSLPATAVLARTGGEGALVAVRLQVGRPVRPMLASPGSSLPAALADLGADVTVEAKLDGARIQVHRDGEQVRVFTRTLHEVSDRVPELAERVRALPCTRVVLDGETLALGEDGRPGPSRTR